MKKIITFILILTLFLPFVYGALVNITKVNFANNPVRAFRLYDGDGISFTNNDKEYIVSVDAIGKTTARLKSFVYNENDEREVIYLFLNNRFSNKIDFDKDNYYDLKVDLGKIEGNSESVVVIFERLHELKSSDKDNKETKSTYDPTGILIAAIIIVFGLIIYFVLKK